MRGHPPSTGAAVAAATAASEGFAPGCAGVVVDGVVAGGVDGFGVGCAAGFDWGWGCAASSGANGSQARLTIAAILQMRPARFVKFIADASFLGKLVRLAIPLRREPRSCFFHRVVAEVVDRRGTEIGAGERQGLRRHSSGPTIAMRSTLSPCDVDAIDVVVIAQQRDGALIRRHQYSPVRGGARTVPGGPAPSMRAIVRELARLPRRSVV